MCNSIPDDGTRTIPLKGGKVAIVDADMFEELSRHKWIVLRNGGYAVYYPSRKEGRKAIFMHKLVCPSPEGMVTDHINGNPLDNRRANLRVTTQGNNVRNSRGRRNTASKYKGVSIVRGSNGNVYYRANCWGAGVPQNKKHLGHYPTEEAAARAYDRRAWELFGEFARFNFPDEDLSKHPPIRCQLHRFHGGKECMRCGAPVHEEYRYRKNGKDVRP